MSITREFTQAKFSTDAFENNVFEGFTDGSLWNGWACPYFTYEIATRVLQMSEANGYRWHYDKNTRSFLVSHIDDPMGTEPERFEGIDILINDSGERVLYAIGAYSWTWEVHRT
jgi:hypothetical protein